MLWCYVSHRIPGRCEKKEFGPQGLSFSKDSLRQPDALCKPFLANLPRVPATWPDADTRC